MLQFNGDRGYKSKSDDDVFVCVSMGPAVSVTLTVIVCVTHSSICQIPTADYHVIAITK